MAEDNEIRPIIKPLPSQETGETDAPWLKDADKEPPTLKTTQQAPVETREAPTATQTADELLQADEAPNIRARREMRRHDPYKARDTKEQIAAQKRSATNQRFGVKPKAFKRKAD